VVREVAPRFVFVENSPMLTSRGLGRVLGDLAAMGYDAEWCVLGANDVGAPHRRKRIWILAHLADSAKLQRNGRDHHAGISPRGEQVSEFGNDCWTPIMAHAGHLRRRDRAEPTETQPTAITGRGEVADATKSGLEGSGERRGTLAGGGGPRRATEPPEGCGEVGNTASERQSRPWQSWYASDPAEDGEGQADRPWAERVGYIWGTESRLGRVAHGVANRMDRLKSIGNGQVPSVAALAWRILSNRISQ
jgi:DNA (cytosine-5)-methyltransferase 1